MRHRRTLISLLVIAVMVTAVDLAQGRFPWPFLHYYQPVDLKAIGYFNFDQALGTINDVPSAFRRLDGRKVAIEGFMWSPTSAARLSDFQFVYNIQNDLHRPPLVQERVFAHVPNGKSVPYVYSYVELMGTLHVDVKHTDGVVVSVYTMDVDAIKVVGSGRYVYPAAPVTPTLYESFLGFLESKGLTLLDLPMAVSWAVVAVFAILTELPALRRRRLRAEGRCPGCGYDLRACSERCPECGSTEGFVGLPPWVYAGNSDRSIRR